MKILASAQLSNGVLGYNPAYVNGGQMVGYLIASDYSDHAALWTSGGLTDLNPTGDISSWVYGTNGMQQVGAGGPGNSQSALLWGGSASSVVVLPSLGYPEAAAHGIGGNQEIGYVGYGSEVNYHQAVAWNGNGDTYVNLNPSAYQGSEGYATNGHQQVGLALAGNLEHAMLWSGTAASAVDLNVTAGVSGSAAYGISDDGSQQVGTESNLYTDYTSEAALWTGSAASWVNLNPAGWDFTVAYGTNGHQQVGSGFNNSGGYSQALVWSGSATSMVDLNDFIPSQYAPMGSYAYAIDSSGDIYGYFAALTAKAYAIEWVPTPVPEPTGLVLIGAFAWALLSARRCRITGHALKPTHLHERPSATARAL
ncbi:MAG: hypothetical protein ABSH08_06520 [Tepidisphaeraceae bacterium]